MNKYQSLFSVLLNQRSVQIEIPAKQLASAKSALSKLKRNYLKENKLLPMEFRSSTLDNSKITYTIKQSLEKSKKLVVLIEIKTQLPEYTIVEIPNE